MLRSLLPWFLSVGCAVSYAFAQGLAPSTPAKEYIRFNGQVVAVENANGATSPFGHIDYPNANNSETLTGIEVLQGWALSYVSAISQVSIAIDGQHIGNANYGVGRGDVCLTYQDAVGCGDGNSNIGWRYSFDTRNLTNGSHTLVVTLTDSGSPAATSFLTTSFTVSNQIAPPGAPQADDFSGGSLNTGMWTIQNSIGDGQLVVANGELQIAVPGGTTHDAYTAGNTGVEALQSVTNSDFAVETKIDSTPVDAYSSEGIMAQQDSANYVRCDVIWGSSGPVAYSALLQGATASNVTSSAIGSSGSYWLRLARQGNVWTCSASIDGSSYTQVNQFTQALTLTKLGVWAGNAAPSGQTPPAFTAIVDYFMPVSTSQLGPPQEDDFTGSSLNTSLWTKQDAIGDGALSLANGKLQIAVPGGTNHDAYTPGNFGVEALQPVANSDFAVEAKFDSTQMAALTSEGIMAQQDAANYVRCDIVYWGDPGLNGYSALLLGSTASHDTSSPVGSSASYWLRLARQGNVWTCSVSTDGSSFTQINQFTQALTLTKIGVWAGNGAPSGQTPPAFTAVVDYFKPVSTSQLGPPQADDFTGSSLNTSLWTKQDAVGDGALSVANGKLQIAVPAGTSHDAYTPGNFGVEALQSIANSDFAVEAKFDSTPTVAFGSEGIMAQQDAANYVRCDIVYWGAPGLNAYSALLLGSSASNEASSPVGSSGSYWLRLSRQANVWTCSVSIDGSSYTQINQFTQALTLTKVGVWAGNGSSNGQTPPAFTALVDYFRPVSTSQLGPPQSDDFTGTGLNTSLWTKQDAVGDGALSVASGKLQITVPAGASHDAYTPGNFGVEALQSVANSDFAVEAKFDSAPTAAFSSEGIMAQQDAANYVRCDLDYWGDPGLNAFSALLQGSSASNEASAPVGSSGSYWLRLARQGDVWTCSVSTDGSSYTQINQFTQALTLTKVGVWAGNGSSNGQTPPAFTALVDYFH